MMAHPEKAFTACEAIVRRADPDRYFSALFAPEGQRRHLFALHALNHELAHVAEAVREPMMGEIRLQWWREGLEGARKGEPRAHDVLRALAETFRARDLPQRLFDEMIDARAADLTTEPFANDRERDTYLDATSGNVMRLAARALGAGDSLDDLAGDAGIAYGMAGLLRSQTHHAARGKVFLPNIETARHDARTRLSQAGRIRIPREAMAAFLPASLAPLYLKNPDREVPLYRKQMAMLVAALRRRV
jgi:phytoene synthase